MNTRTIEIIRTANCQKKVNYIRAYNILIILSWKLRRLYDTVYDLTDPYRYERKKKNIYGGIIAYITYVWIYSINLVPSTYHKRRTRIIHSLLFNLSRQRYSLLFFSNLQTCLINFVRSNSSSFVRVASAIYITYSTSADTISWSPSLRRYWIVFAARYPALNNLLIIIVLFEKNKKIKFTMFQYCVEFVVVIVLTIIAFGMLSTHKNNSDKK